MEWNESINKAQDLWNPLFHKNNKNTGKIYQKLTFSEL